MIARLRGWEILFNFLKDNFLDNSDERETLYIVQYQPNLGNEQTKKLIALLNIYFITTVIYIILHYLRQSTIIQLFACVQPCCFLSKLFGAKQLHSSTVLQ